MTQEPSARLRIAHIADEGKGPGRYNHIPIRSFTVAVRECIQGFAEELRKETGIFADENAEANLDLWLTKKIKQTLSSQLFDILSEADGLHRNIAADIEKGPTVVTKISHGDLLPDFMISDDYMDEGDHLYDAARRHALSYVHDLAALCILREAAQHPDTAGDSEMLNALSAHAQARVTRERECLTEALYEQLHYFRSDKLQAIGEAAAYVTTLESMFEKKFATRLLRPVRGASPAL